MDEGKKDVGEISETIDEEMVDKSEKVISKNEETFTDKMRENPWVVATLVLGVLCLILLVSNFTGTGKVISGDDAGERLLSFFESNGAQGLAIKSVEEVSGVYRINFEYQGAIIPYYVTRDGFLAGSLTPLATTTSSDNSDKDNSQEIPKADKPKVELFIMSMCPYGTQAEKGIIPAIRTLGDKIDFKLRFVSYAMHGKDEIDENTMLYCVQEEEPTKLLDYMECYLDKNDPNIWRECLSKVGISEDKINDCINKVDKEFKITELFNDKSSWLSGRYPPYNIDKELDDRYGVRGSPTLVINGVTVVSDERSCGTATNCVVYSSAGRSASAYLSTICNSFNESPEECNIDLSSFGNPAPGFGFSIRGDSSNNNVPSQCG